MSIADLETLYEAAIAALDSGDYDTAIVKANALQLRLATMPSVTQRQGGRTEFTAEWIDRFIAQCRKLKSETAAAAATGGPFQVTKITYARPDRLDRFS